jgi:hypothetical protein
MVGVNQPVEEVAEVEEVEVLHRTPCPVLHHEEIKNVV